MTGRERKEGRREKRRPCDGRKPLREEHFSGYTVRQNNQTEASACAPDYQVAGYLCVAWGHLSVRRSRGKGRGDAHLLPELRVAVFPCLAAPSPSISGIQAEATHSQGGDIWKE